MPIASKLHPTTVRLATDAYAPGVASPVYV